MEVVAKVPARRPDAVHEMGADTDSRFAAPVSLLALFLLSYPALVLYLPDISAALLVLASALLLPLLISRVSTLSGPSAWLLVLAVSYAISSWTAPNREQGVIHTLAIVCGGTAFLAFALYGGAMLRQTWFRWAACFIVAVNIAAIIMADLTKNAEGSVLFYNLAILFVVAISRGSVSGAWGALAFTALAVLISIDLGVRSLVAYSLFFVAAYFVSNRLPPRWYRLLGIAVCSTVIFATAWFFINIYGSELAARISRKIAEISGEHADTGRQRLWPYILQVTKESPIFGLGAGTLPRDVMSTQLSSHNYYLQVYLQLGIFGLAILIVFLLAVWKRLSLTNTAVGRFGSALFLAFVIHNGTEVLMFQNQTLIGVPAWCAIGLALGWDSEAKARPALPKVGGGEDVSLSIVRRDTLSRSRTSSLNRRRTYGR